MTLIPAYKKDHDLMAEADGLVHDEDSLHLWWLGQSGFLIQWQGQRVLMDPYLSDSLTHKYANTDKPHIRMSALVIRPELLTNISLVTSSHNHTDHLDAETLIPVFRQNPQIKFVIPEANRSFVTNKLNYPEITPIGLTDNHSINIDSFYLHGIPAKHNDIARDEHGRPKYMGYVLEIGPYKIYHSGDTLYFDEMIDILLPLNIDIALLPINGNDPARGVAGNLDCAEAVHLGLSIGAKYVIPCHYNMFSFNTADVHIFTQIADALGLGYCVLHGGEKFSYIRDHS